MALNTLLRFCMVAIALLLFAAAPVMAAEDNAPAPPPIEHQVRDAVLEQLQMRTREAEIRAEQAERRERDTELEKLTDQAKQAQSRADTEEQLKRVTERELFIQQAKAELQNNAYARLEILIGAFGILITAIVVFFAWNTKETAVSAAKAGVEDIREKLEARLVEAEALVAKLRDHETRTSNIVAALSPGEVPKSVEDRKTIAEAAMAALAKLPRDRTVDDYRTIIINSQALENWPEMLRAAQQMKLLYSEELSSFVFANYSKAYALAAMGRAEESVAAFEEVIQRVGELSRPMTQSRAATILTDSGVRFGQKGLHEEAIVLYDSVISNFASSNSLDVQEQVAKALYNKAYAFGQLARYEKAITVCEDMIARYEASDMPPLQEQFAKALFYKAYAHGQLEQHEMQLPPAII